MKNINSPAFSAIILYVLFVMIIVLIKPSQLYDQQNKLKEINFNDPFNLVFVGAIMSVIFYCFVSLIN